MSRTHEREVLEILNRLGVIRRGHFVYTSGRHGDSYIEKRAIYSSQRDLGQLCSFMARIALAHPVQAVLGPMTGGAELSQWTSFHLSLLSKRHIRGLHADKDGRGGFTLTEEVVREIFGRGVLIVDDIATTGGSIRKVAKKVREAGATVLLAVVICNRGSIRAEDADVPLLEQLAFVDLESYLPKRCPLCRQNVPINTDLGHGAHFRAEKK